MKKILLIILALGGVSTFASLLKKGEAICIAGVVQSKKFSGYFKGVKSYCN